MKISKKCPKCNSQDIAITTGASGGPVNTIIIGATYFSSVVCDKYVCLNCGYIEQWVHNDKDLDKISKKCKHY